MIKIEKIHSPYEQNFSAGIDGSCQGHPLPGYIDFFNSNQKTYYWNRYCQVSKNFNNCIPDDILIGKEYGVKGISYTKLLTTKPDDTIYEICYDHLSLLPPRILKPIIENYRILLCDIMEGGMLGLMYEKFINDLYTDYNVREILRHNAGYKFGLITYSTSTKKDFNYKPSKLAVVLARKPRRTRVDFLNKLHEKELLKDCDWSLYYNNNNIIDTSLVEKLQRFNLAEYPNLEIEYPDFYNTHKSMLPKSLHDQTINSLHNTDIDPNYKFFISLEPEGDEHFNTLLGSVDDIFITEKTFKAFGAGIPCMIYGKAGIENKLKDAGFKFYFDNYDHLERQDRIDVMIDCLTHDHNIDKLHNIALHNYNLFWNKELLLNMSFKELYEN